MHRLQLADLQGIFKYATGSVPKGTKAQLLASVKDLLDQFKTALLQFEASGVQPRVACLPTGATAAPMASGPPVAAPQPLPSSPEG